MHGNIFYRCSAGGFGSIQIHGGKDNKVSQNLFVDCRTSISFQPWGDKRWRVVAAQSFHSSEIDSALYLSRYPELALLAESHDSNTICNNVNYLCGRFLRGDSSRNKLIDNIITNEDPGFTDAMHGIFSLPKNAPILKRGKFLPILFYKIGLYCDEFRNALPTQVIRKARAE